MDLKNAARFDEVVHSVFLALADAFPKAIDLDPQALGLAPGPAYVLDGSGRQNPTEHIEAHTFAAACIRFLEAEGYISGKAHPTWATSVVLTSKGLERIGGLPTSLRIVY
jgi:hypothetical protein